MKKERKAFTLIELLIVVAIIAILAAIAIPNFLEAQVRAKASRVKNDHRALATALESYFVDYNKYPGDADNNPFHGRERGFYRLTTPVAYMTSWYTDPFSDATKSNDPNDESVARNYQMGCSSDNHNWNSEYQCYIVISIGPNKEGNFVGTDEFPEGTFINVYDPTNGTISHGDMYRAGGDWRSGEWYINGLPYQEWGIGPSMPE